jgi:hypothetical protein
MEAGDEGIRPGQLPLEDIPEGVDLDYICIGELYV